MYGKCGINCSQCPAFINNIKSFEDQVKCSDGWKKYLNIKCKPEDCVCLGCQAKDPWKDGNIIPDRSCLVKRCVEHSGYKTCANCKVYPCEHVKDRGHLEYTRKWVENRIGCPMSEEDYLAFVETYEARKHISEIKENLESNEILDPVDIKPLKVKMVNRNLVTDAGKVLYDFLYNLQSCINAKSYIEQVLTERRIKPALAILWVFGRDGVLSEDGQSLLIEKDKVTDLKPYNNIVRKRDNTWHGSVNQVASLFRYHGLEMKHNKISRKDWYLTLYLNNDSEYKNLLKITKTTVDKLIKQFENPEYVSAWNFKGDAFKKFIKGNI